MKEGREGRKEGRKEGGREGGRREERKERRKKNYTVSLCFELLQVTVIIFIQLWHIPKLTMLT
jgi:hypothetical protein